MRINLFFRALLILVITFQSCEYSEIENDLSKSINILKIKNVQELKGDTQIITFNLLNSDEKVHLWKNKMNSLTADDNLSEVQKKAINSLKVFLVSDLYDDTKNIILNEELKGWVFDNEDKFTRNELINYFMKINPVSANSIDFEIIDDDPDGGGGGSVDKCECSKFDDWCVSWEDCKSATCEEKRGCGFFWNRICDGECKTKNP